MKAVEKVAAYIADAVKLVTGGKRVAQGGCFFEPGVLTHDNRHSHHQSGDLRRGGLLYRFRTDAEAIEMANDI